MMRGFRAKLRVATLVVVSVWVVLLGIYQLMKPVSNGCAMTYMYPTYIPISHPVNASSGKYGLYLYHEGWKKIDWKEHLKKLSGVPVLFIPGNSGSYKQVRSLAAESSRAYQGGPLERTFYQEASLTPEQGEMDNELSSFQLPNQYTSMLDWFAVDLEGEHSAMDGRILEEHTEYVVHAIHRILDQYKESRDAREKEGAADSGILPKSVILVGHSMGGFVARATIIHPKLKKYVVETVLTLSAPHQSPPLALQPSLGHYFANVNQEWRTRYGGQNSQTGHDVSDIFSHVMVISISGGINDHQVRPRLESLEGIVPSTHGFTISSTCMRNVWLSMEHQAILWCNQVVVQVSHTLLSLIDSKTGQPFPSSRKRLTIFTKMLRNGTPRIVDLMSQSHIPTQSIHVPVEDKKDAIGSRVQSSFNCPDNVHWNEDGLERDLYIETNMITVLAMDGRRRWLDIHKLGSNGKNHFMFVTNLAPCSGVKIHLWPGKDNSTSHLPSAKRVVEVTSKMMRIPSGPAPRQIEPGSQTEQAPPSALLWLGPEDMHGFRFLTVSVAPRPTVSGRPPPATSMAVGQFFNPKEGKRELSSWDLLNSLYSEKEVLLKEEHSLAFNLTFAISLGLMPVTLSLKTAGCGIKDSGLPAEEAGDAENNRLCKLRCFPPVALAWDSTSGLHIFPNLFSETVVVDSSPAVWDSIPGSEKTTVLLLVDPHCSYKTSIVISFTSVAGRFLLVYGPQMCGFSIAVVFFALMRQVNAWDSDLHVPSMLAAVEFNLRLPMPFLLVAIFPILISLLLSSIGSQSYPPFASFIIVSMICYLIVNAAVIILTLITQMVFYVAAIVHVFIKRRWQGSFSNNVCQWVLQIFSMKMIRIVRANPLIAAALVAITLVCFVHPALGLFTLLISDVFCCHNALCSFLTASFRSHAQSLDSGKKGYTENQEFALRHNRDLNKNPSLNENYCSSPDTAKSFSETQLELFHQRHGLLLLHLLATLMFVPSFISWLQRITIGQSFPWFLDSALCIGVILHGICNSKLESNYLSYKLLGMSRCEVRMSFIYFIAGCFCYLSGLAMAPYKAFYAMAAMGIISWTWKFTWTKNGDKGGSYFNIRKHFHRH